MSHRTTRRTLGTVLALPLTLALGAGVAFAQASGSSVDRPSGDADGSFSISATAGAVPQEDGERGNDSASATYDLDLYTDAEVVCYDISVSGVSGDWESPAPTANHIHAGNVGLVGPAIVAFPNPEMGSGGDFTTSGCLEDALINSDDSGVTSLAQIDANPAGFYVDIHTSEFPRGDVRGNLQGTRVSAGGGGGDTGADAGGDADADASPMPQAGQGPEAGFGGAAGEESRTAALTGAALLLALAGAATASQMAGRREQA